MYILLRSHFRYLIIDSSYEEISIFIFWVWVFADKIISYYN